MGFMDMREWMSLLEKAGELRRVTAEVDWDREIGAVARRVLEKKGPALLFENIKGYASGRCTKLFTGTACPNCLKPIVFYDGTGPRWTFEARAFDPWAEWVCPIFFDDDIGNWRHACIKEDP